EVLGHLAGGGEDLLGWLGVSPGDPEVLAAVNVERIGHQQTRVLAVREQRVERLGGGAVRVVPLDEFDVRAGRGLGGGRGVRARDGRGRSPLRRGLGRWRGGGLALAGEVNGGGDEQRGQARRRRSAPHCRPTTTPRSRHVNI